MTRLVMIAMLLVPLTTRAQELPDVPLPRWHPPARTATVRLLGVTPELAHAQRLRQAGLWVSSLGWAAVLTAGILQARAGQLANHETVVQTGWDEHGRPIYTSTFSPEPAPERARDVHAATALFSVGGALAASGIVMFAVGQTRISRWHHERPDDSLPQLSGY